MLLLCSWFCFCVKNVLTKGRRNIQMSKQNHIVKVWWHFSFCWLPSIWLFKVGTSHLWSSICTHSLYRVRFVTIKIVWNQYLNENLKILVGDLGCLELSLSLAKHNRSQRKVLKCVCVCVCVCVCSCSTFRVWGKWS